MIFVSNELTLDEAVEFPSSEPPESAVVCDTCDGYGLVPVWSDWAMQAGDCPVCLGEGWTDEGEEGG